VLALLVCIILYSIHRPCYILLPSHAALLPLPRRTSINAPLTMPHIAHISHQLHAVGKPAIGGPWSLVDLQGNFVTNKTFEGKWLLLYFGFARCPDICPSEMNKVAQVMDTLKVDQPAIYDKVVPVFVSIDPARDSLQALKSYAQDFHPSYVFLTGSPQQVQSMAKSYRVYVSKADETPDGDYLVDHSIVVYFHDDTGDLADVFTQSMRPTDIIKKMIEVMKMSKE
jgi:protein SCO1